MLLILVTCADDPPEIGTSTSTDDPLWPKATLVARDGMPLLTILDDEVLFEGVPFEGDLTIVDREFDPRDLEDLGIVEEVSLSTGEGEPMKLSIDEFAFTIAPRGEEVEFDGRRVRLADGAKQVVFTKAGGVEVSERD